MTILGINAYHADSSAAIFVDGKLIAATEEERLRRVKHWAGFPSMAIAFCLKEVGATIDQVDYITTGRDSSAKLASRLLYLLSDPFSSLRATTKRLAYHKSILSLEGEFAKHFDADPRMIKPKIRHIEHHRSHMASAFYASPFDEAAILSIDGSGDFTTTMIGVGNGSLQVLDSINFPASCGLFYMAFTHFLGFPHYGDEYKVMGLAPYGKPIYADKVKKVLKFTNDGLFTWDKRYFKSPREVMVQFKDHVPSVPDIFSNYFVEQFGTPRRERDELTQYHKDLAASVQHVTEELILYMLRNLHRRTGLQNVCIAGGVAQNSVANGKIIGNTGFEKLYIPSAGHDAGLSMGSALYLYHHLLKKPRTKPIYSAYTGSRFTNEEIESILQKKGIQYSRLDDNALYEKVVDKLIEPGVVGWFSGRAEFGPRALGARSIIADPRNPKAKDLLNLKIKRRESFRPFAPSILKEYTGEYFEKVEDVPFMEKVFPIRKEKRDIIPAVTHVDGTGRLQTVIKEVSPRYHALISKFRERTGVPILLNTSFNENEPIVNTPLEALDCFLRTQMDMLVLENCVVER